jgi:hypothetical protein
LQNDSFSGFALVKFTVYQPFILVGLLDSFDGFFFTPIFWKKSGIPLVAGGSLAYPNILWED